MPTHGRREENQMNRVVNAGLLLATAVSITAAQNRKPARPTPLQAAITLYDAEKIDQAKTTLTPLAKSGDPDAMLYLGRIAIDQSDFGAAVDWLEQATKKNDRNSSYHQWLGMAYGAKANAGNPFTAMTLVP